MNDQTLTGADTSLRHRFPSLTGVAGEWSRFDGPSGTQMVDTALTAVNEWVISGDTAAVGGPFPAAQRCAELLEQTRMLLGRLFSADPQGFSFGPNTTSNNMALANAVSDTLGPGDTIVSTKLDHDSNVMPWRRVCQRSGARQLMADFDPSTGVLSADAVIALIDETTRWVTLPMASNLLGTMPDLEPIIDAAHQVGGTGFCRCRCRRSTPQHRHFRSGLRCPGDFAI